MMRRRVEAATSDRAKGGIHLAIFVEPFLGAVLDGRKTLESRFAKNRCAPFGTVSEGDLVFLKKSGGPVVGVASVGEPMFHHIGDGTLAAMRQSHAEALFAEDDGFWDDRREKRYATLIPIDHVVQFEPIGIDKKDRRGWVTYREKCGLF